MEALFQDNFKFIKEDFSKRFIRLDDALRAITPENATNLPDDQLVILITARKKLKSAPIVDAVEVVRCKDCFANGCCSVQDALEMGDEGYCPKGRKET